MEGNGHCSYQSGYSVKIGGRQEPVKQVPCAEIHPHIRDSIMGDGSCLFTKGITGKQSNHQALRMAIVNFMIIEENALMFANHHFGKMHTSQEEALHSLKLYLQKSRMREHGFWGTEREIITAATLFQVDINVFCQYGNVRTWMTNYPIFTNSTCLPKSNVKLYLYHKVDHYDLILPEDVV